MLQLLTRHALLLSAALALAACGVNPVTGKKELQFVSESQEVQIGQENYQPSRQTQGGDLVIDPELQAYVSEVGNRLARVADRPLPYEFSVLNNSVPNAWALPGGKIAVNRGLLTRLNSEAELAAVLGHEIVHAAARHGARSMERGMLLQGAMVALAVGVQDNQYANLIVGGAMLGANLISTRYGRDAELESDAYGMRYMQRAGYDPAAAIDLQKTFVKLSEGRRQNWLEGLFATHPPSQERVAKNEQTARELGAGGDYGRERYQEKLANLRRLDPA
jgi:beta-barrel assembly-enhancing protease